jgi:hypothetical protein
MNASLSDLVNRRVTADEVRRAMTRTIPSDERDEVLALIRWFTTRYPTPEERLEYVRIAYARWVNCAVSAKTP